MQKNVDKSVFSPRTVIRALALAAMTLCGGNVYADNIVTEWDDVTLDAIRAVHPAPTHVSRQLAVVHTAIFDAWAAYDEHAVGTRLGKKLRQPKNLRTEANKHTAISYAAYEALIELFPSEKPRFDKKMEALGYSTTDSASDKKSPVFVGRTAGQAVVEARRKDGANGVGTDTPWPEEFANFAKYESSNAHDKVVDPNRWVPLKVLPHIGCHGDTDIQVWCTPYWGRVTPFALKTGNQFRPKGPATVGQQLYKDQAEHVVQATAALDDRTKMIAEFWMDGPTSELPPGHWAMIAKKVSDRDHHNLDQDAKMFFAMTNAVFDAGIAAWDVKRAFDSVRPITAIQYLYKDKTIPYYDGKTVLGQNWMPYQPKMVVTPPFAEYVSGHSTFSAAAAEVLKRFTGSDKFGDTVTLAVGTSRVQPGVAPTKPVTLSWATFTEAADQAGLSRIYGGIHFEQGDRDGQDLGRKVAAVAWDKYQGYINGKK